MLLLQRSIGNRRRRRPLLPLGLRVVSLDSPGLVAVFLVGNRSSSVARAAGPSVACGSRSLSGRRARSRSVVVVCGRVPAAAAGAAAAPRSRGRPFRRCGSSTAFFVCVRAFCAALRLLRRRCRSGLTQAVSALLFPVSPAPASLSGSANKSLFRSSKFTPRGRDLCPCVRGDDAEALTVPWA
jgi:hypothetical protein